MQQFYLLFAQSVYGSDAYGGNTYSGQTHVDDSNTSTQPGTPDQSATTTTQTTQATSSGGSTLADTGVGVIVPVLGGTFLIATAAAIIAMKVRRKQRNG